MENPSLWQRLTTPVAVEEVFAPAAVAYLVFFAVGFLAALVLSGGGGIRRGSHPATRRMVRRTAAIAVWCFGAGLFFFGVRALGINPFGFGAPIWLWLCLALVVALAVWFAYDRLRNHPRRVATLAEQERNRQYLQPRGKAKLAAPARVPEAATPKRPRAARP